MITFISEKKSFDLFSILLIIFFRFSTLESKLTIFPFLNPDWEKISFSIILKLSSSSYSPTTTNKFSSLSSKKRLFFFNL